MKIDIDINTIYEETKLIIQAPEMSDEVTDLLKKLKEDKPTSLSGKKAQKIYVIDLKDIILIYAQNNKVLVSTMDDTYEVKQKLYEVEEIVSGGTFVRISKSAIVNIKGIKNIEVSFNGSLVVKCLNGQEEIISRRFVPAVKSFIGLGGK